jgi:hypothetical protein
MVIFSGYVKGRICFTKVTSVQDKNGIVCVCSGGIPPQMCDTTFWAFEYWMDIVWAPKEA